MTTGKAASDGGVRPRAQDELRADLPAYPQNEVRAGGVVHRNDDGSEHGATEKCRHPFRRIRPPDHNPVAFFEGARGELARQAKRGLRHLPVRPAHAAVAARLHVGGFIPALLKLIEVFDERTACHVRLAAVPALDRSSRPASEGQPPAALPYSRSIVHRGKDCLSSAGLRLPFRQRGRFPGVTSAGACRDGCRLRRFWLEPLPGLELASWFPRLLVRTLTLGNP